MQWCSVQICILRHHTPLLFAQPTGGAFKSYVTASAIFVGVASKHVRLLMLIRCQLQDGIAAGVAGKNGGELDSRYLN